MFYDDYDVSGLKCDMYTIVAADKKKMLLKTQKLL